MKLRTRRRDWRESSWPSNDEPLDEELSHVRRNPIRWQYGGSTTDDFVEPRGVPRPLRFRHVAWRFIGAVAIGAAFYGVGRVATHPEARHAIAEWITLGHADKAEKVERAIDRSVGWVKDEWSSFTGP
jgi:hypothetical protein